MKMCREANEHGFNGHIYRWFKDIISLDAFNEIIRMTSVL